MYQIMWTSRGQHIWEKILKSAEPANCVTVTRSQPVKRVGAMRQKTPYFEKCRMPNSPKCGGIHSHQSLTRISTYWEFWMVLKVCKI